MSSFADLGVPAPLCATLARRGINEPFPIQAATLPDSLAGRDVAGKAPTGSGKTLAFGLAIAAQAMRAGKAESRRPRALVLVPTRELAAQVQRELTALVDERAHGPVVAVYGGVGYGPQRALLHRGASAVVACPGRLEDLVAGGDVRLDEVELVVLDEADRMADMGFMPAVRRLLDRTPDDRQTLLFSATLDGDVDKLVRSYQREPIHHEAAGADDDDVEVTHRFWTVARAERVGLTADIARRAGSTIVFTRTRHGADRVTRQLGREGVKAVPIHGRRSQAQRDQALKQFSTGRAPVLVATDVAARGIHVDAVGCVVHFDLPDDPKDYVHRSGRTGRAGAPGLVIALVDQGDRKPARVLQKALGRTEPIEAADPTSLAQAPAVVGGGRADVDEQVVAERDDRTDRAGRTAADRRDDRGSRNGRDRRDDRGSRNGRDRQAPRADRGERPGRDERDERRAASHGRNGSSAGEHPRRRRPHRDGADRQDAGRDFAGAGAGTERGRRGGRLESGTVSSFNPKRGYGFISRRGGADVFVHVSALSGESALQPGQRVRFELAPGKRGQQARNVQPTG